MLDTVAVLMASQQDMQGACRMLCLQMLAAAVCASHRGSLLQAEDRQMQAISDRLMGDAAEQGDISFGGEVSVEAQVSCWSIQLQLQLYHELVCGVAHSNAGGQPDLGFNSCRPSTCPVCCDKLAAAFRFNQQGVGI